MVLIEDPKNCSAACVTPEGLLYTLGSNAELVQTIAHLSGLAWIYRVVATTNGSDNTIFHLKNDSSDDMCCAQLAVMSTTDAHWTFGLGASYTSGGAANTPVSCNRGFSIAPSFTAYSGDAITVAGSTAFADELTKGGYLSKNVEFRQALILPPGKSFDIKCNASAGTAYTYLVVYKHNLEL